MSKVEYTDVYGLWGNKGEATAKMPICPKCKQPTYNQNVCAKRRKTEGGYIWKYV